MNEIMDNWVELKEHKCPVEPKTKVQVKYEFTTGAIDCAERFAWDSRIKFYRIVNDLKDISIPNDEMVNTLDFKTDTPILSIFRDDIRVDFDIKDGVFDVKISGNITEGAKAFLEELKKMKDMFK